MNAYDLEFDDARFGGFEPLAAVSGEKKAVLALVKEIAQEVWS